MCDQPDNSFLPGQMTGIAFLKGKITEDIGHLLHPQPLNATPLVCHHRPLGEELWKPWTWTQTGDQTHRMILPVGIKIGQLGTAGDSTVSCVLRKSCKEDPQRNNLIPELVVVLVSVLVPRVPVHELKTRVIFG